MYTIGHGSGIRIYCARQNRTQTVLETALGAASQAELKGVRDHPYAVCQAEGGCTPAASSPGTWPRLAGHQRPRRCRDLTQRIAPVACAFQSSCSPLPRYHTLGLP